MVAHVTVGEPRPDGRLRPAVAGAVGVGVSLGLTELLAGMITGVPSAVSSVGTIIVDRSPPALEDLAISMFGTADKAALAVGTVVVALAIGAAVGLRARHNWNAAVAWFALFGFLGLLASIAQPLTSVWLTLLAAVVSVVAGLAALRRLLRLAPPEAPTDGLPGDRTRRHFLGSAAGLGVGALGAGVVGRAMLRTGGTPGEIGDLAVPTPATPAPAVPSSADLETSIEGLTPVVVPNDDFYRIDTALVVPRIDAERWRLHITGMVDREVEFDLATLYGQPIVEHYVTIACVSNEVGGDLVGNAKWGGVPLRGLLEQVGVQDGADQLVGRSIDGWTAGFPTELVFDGREPLLALFMNGEPLPPRHGFPARLIVPGLYGYVSATKWLTEIELTTWDGFDAYWVPRGWAKEGPIKTQSRIDVPRDGDSFLASEPFTVAGVAWAPLTGIARVEIQVDDGDWLQAELSQPLSEAAWVQWRAEASLPSPGSHLISVRATDGTGTVQTDERVPPRPDGATGHHTIRVTATST
ncbi:MAG: molybdopterin-dependent oxidoreductase [Actinobacteria bacterium]|nr:molybdopterin-dependent oxidoreductase [Actinomycetota bacterium]